MSKEIIIFRCVNCGTYLGEGDLEGLSWITKVSLKHRASFCSKCWLDKGNNNWKKEFEDELDCIYKISQLITKYLKWHKRVKIKCKDGCIQIERI